MELETVFCIILASILIIGLLFLTINIFKMCFEKEKAMTTVFDFKPAAMNIIDRLKDDMYLQSRAEVLRRALALLDVAVAAKEGGVKIFFKKEGKYQEIIL